MKNERYALAGLVFSGTGLILGMAMSSAMPSTPLVVGTTIAVYAAVAAAVLGGIRKRGGALS